MTEISSIRLGITNSTLKFRYFKNRHNEFSFHVQLRILEVGRVRRLGRNEPRQPQKFEHGTGSANVSTQLQASGNSDHVTSSASALPRRVQPPLPHSSLLRLLCLPRSLPHARLPKTRRLSTLTASGFQDSSGLDASPVEPSLGTTYRRTRS